MERKRKAAIYIFRPCRVCGDDRRYTHGRVCVTCKNNRHKDWRLKNPDKRKKHDSRDRGVRHLEMDRKRRGLPEPTRPCPDRCENCGRSPIYNALHLDHDPRTGKFRGWLCVLCNPSIGALGDNIAGLERALDYLRRNGSS